MWHAIVVDAGIAGCGYKQDTFFSGCSYGIFERSRVRSSTPTRADHANVDAALFHLDNVIDGLDGITHRSAAVTGNKPDRHNIHMPVDADNTLTVVAFCSNDTGAMGTVIVD